jgi:hypothetical protein
MKLLGLSFPREDTSNEAEGGIAPKSKAGTEGCAADHVSQSRRVLECGEFLLLPETWSRGTQMLIYILQRTAWTHTLVKTLLQNLSFGHSFRNMFRQVCSISHTTQWYEGYEITKFWVTTEIKCQAWSRMGKKYFIPVYCTYFVCINNILMSLYEGDGLWLCVCYSMEDDLKC